MVGFLSVLLGNVQVHPALCDKASEELLHYVHVEIANFAFPGRKRIDEIWPPTKVHRHLTQRLVHRDQAPAVTVDSLAVAERLIQRLAQREADILYGVMVVHLEIAFRPHIQIEQRVFREQIEHVIEECDAGLVFIDTGSINIKINDDVRFFRLPRNSSRAFFHYGVQDSEVTASAKPEHAKQMNQEIERKFLTRSDDWRAAATATKIFRQGYLSLAPARIVRVRLAGNEAWLTIKGDSDGPARTELEYAIPPSDAQEMLDHLCLPGQINKTRHFIPHGTLVFEVDVFHDENEGLILAELEIPTKDANVELPAWIGDEVTGDPRYFNAYLVQHPFRSWSTR